MPVRQASSWFHSAELFVYTERVPTFLMCIWIHVENYRSKLVGSAPFDTVQTFLLLLRHLSLICSRDTTGPGEKPPLSSETLSLLGDPQVFPDQRG